jgi:hypothetical protein
MNHTILTLLAACGLAVGARPLDTAAHAADPWADFATYAGPAAAPGYNDPNAALGKPTLFTDPLGNFGGVVTPLNASFGQGETISILAGGTLTLQFAEPVTNDPLNPFGIDLLLFGNSFFSGDFFSQNPTQIIDSLFSEGGSVSVSNDGVTFHDVLGEADGLFPTNAYADIVQPFTNVPGAVEADFTLPVDPAFNPIGKTYAQMLAGYNGSGGGLGVDIGAVGLSSITHVRITNPVGSVSTPEIDAAADVRAVPEPAAGTIVLSLALILLGKSARTSNVKAVT